MATVSKDRIKTDTKGRKYIVVIAGDTLSDIAYAHFGNGTQEYWERLATLNKLADANHIVVGQTIYLTSASDGSATPSSAKNDGGVKCPTVTVFGVLAGDNSNKLTAVWTWPKREDTKEFDVEWKSIKHGFISTNYKDETVWVDRQYSTYDIPSDESITKVQFRVRPVPKTDTKDGKEVNRFATNLWTDWNDCTYIKVNRPDIPTGLTVKLEGLELTATVSNPGKSKASLIKFQLVAEGNLNTANLARAAVDDASTSVAHTFKVEAGHKYQVRCCANKDGNDSDWSDFSTELETRPAKVTLSDPVVKSEKSISLTWSASTTADSYLIQYTTDKNGFYEGVSKTDITVDSKETTTYVVNNLSSGLTYSFRIMAKKGTEESEWSDVKTAVIGTEPTVPTTWSSTTTAIGGEAGESVAIYWVHNATDGSTQKSAQVTLIVEGVDNLDSIKNDVTEGFGKIDKIEVIENQIIYTVTAGTSTLENNPTHYLVINTEDFTDGAVIDWNVKTVSSADKTSKASANRRIEIFSRPTVYMSVGNKEGDDIREVGAIYYKVEYQEALEAYTKTFETLLPLTGDPVSGAFTAEGDYQVRTAIVDGETIYYCVVEEDSLTSLPINVQVRVETNEKVQKPIEYFVTISANEPYDTVDNFGNPVTVSTGQILYSKHYTASGIDKLNIDISASDVSLSNGQNYTVKCLVAMSSGLFVEAFTEMHISWSADNYYLSAQIGYNESDYSTYVRPYCDVIADTYYKVTQTGSSYFLSDDTYDYVYGTILPNAVTTTGEQVYQGTLVNGNRVYFSIISKHERVKDVLFSVYRREYDGSFTPIIEDLDGNLESFVTDPHPSLDFARYRIVAKDKRTSKVSYSDISNYPIGEKAIIMQWDEPPTSFAVSEDSLGSVGGSQSFVRLPYNIDVANTKDPEVSLIKYIGRKHPVAYYGTQLGEVGAWSTVVPKSDTETLYALQRLQGYTGNVYVREPNGVGYWANVKVAFARKHLETTVPVSIDITRVEGGA